MKKLICSSVFLSLLLAAGGTWRAHLVFAGSPAPGGSPGPTAKAASSSDGLPDVNGDVNSQIAPEEVADLLEWAKDSKKALATALEEGRRNPYEQRRAYLVREIQTVLLQSKLVRTELFMRRTLNRILWVDTLLGSNVSDPVYQIALDFLEAGIQSAIGYFDLEQKSLDLSSGEDAPKSAKTVKRIDPPYAEFGLSYANQFFTWGSLRMPTLELEYQYVKEGLGRLARDLNDDIGRRRKLAYQILAIVTELRRHETTPPQNMTDYRVAIEDMMRIYLRTLKETGSEDGQRIPGGTGSTTLNPLGMKFATVRAGKFMMGSKDGSDGEAGRFDDEKLHSVQLPNDYEIQTTTVTRNQWYDVMVKDHSDLANPSSNNAESDCPGQYLADKHLCPNHPVTDVSWEQVVNLFLPALNTQTHDGYAYRLPTEAEWEYAARAGTPTAYSFGNDPNQLPYYVHRQTYPS